MKCLKSWLSIILLNGWILLLPTVALANNAGETHTPGISSLVFPSINFILYFFLLRWLYRKYGISALKNHREQISSRLQQAQVSLSNAQESLEQQNQRLSKIDQERQSVFNAFEEEGKLIAQNIIAQAQASAALIAKETTRQLESDLELAKQEIREKVIKRAAEFVRIKLSTGVSVEMDRNLRRDVITSIVNY